MGAGYFLVNFTKREIIRYEHIPASKANELAGNPVSSAITTWYMLQNSGDQISFVSDTNNDWPFPEHSREDLNSYQEITNLVVDKLIDSRILEDRGISWADEDEPNTIFVRDLRNIWMD